MLTPVILCGGSGTRLWPLSRTHYPKQFLRLVDERSLLQNTALRLAGLPQLARPIAVTGDSHRFLLAEQFLEVGVTADILLEPVARNTAPAVAAAAAWALKRGGESPVLLVLPSDHVITDVQAFHRAVMTGFEHAEEGKLVTFGIVPVGPETGYGYIQKGTVVTGGFALRRFVEKPDAATALRYLASGDYLWNSGMFLFRADTYLAALDRLNPAITGAARNSVEFAQTDLDFIRLDSNAFASSPEDSIDYAVMEKVSDGIVISLDAGWNDIGAWDALARSCATDAAGNLLRGDVLATDTRNSVLLSGSRLVAAVGVEDLVVVETPDAVLVAHKSQTQKVKQIVSQLKAAKREEADLHREVHRPWGSYEGLVRGERYQVKRIVVKPGRSLSLQLHHHRAEHWVVVRGTARITRGEEVMLLTENQSTFIPLGVK
ncbi:MAG: mannose-1-phosphate guanylyltransferase/mannose-6-phosphate isomerase, partial [Burkholderiales bacterium]